MKVLVTDANNRVALSVVRALGRAGCVVTAVEQKRFASPTPPTFLSRHVAHRRVLPNLEEGFVDALAAVAREVDAVVPVSTNVVVAVAAERTRFRSVALPPLETIRRANDKIAVLDVARRAGVPVPAHYAREFVRFPAVVKMRDDEGTYLEPVARYRIVTTPEELRRALDELKNSVVQEWVKGEGYGCGFLAREGDLLAAFCHRRVREFPVSGGPSTMCESVVDGTLVGYARALARELRWTGVAMAEFKRDSAGGYRLLEINPRFWGSLPLAVRAGINFPHLLCRMATGESLHPILRYREGVRLRFLPIDLRAAMASVRHPELRGKHVWGFLRDLLDPSVSDGILDLADPRASAAYLLNRLRG